MAHSSFGPAWPNCDRAGRIVTLTRADGLRLAIHRDLADLVAILMDLTEASGYDIRPGQTWGYACRPIAGTRTPSNHSQGTAVDINAPTNPRRARGLAMRTDMPPWMRRLWKDNGFRWGGDFSWPDPMHYEFTGTVDDARRRVANLRAFLAAAGRPAPAPPHSRRPVPIGGGYPGTVRLGSYGAAVRVWQDVFRQRGYAIAVDAKFGPGTHAVVRDWQTRHRHQGLKVDGIAGPATWHSALFT